MQSHPKALSCARRNRERRSLYDDPIVKKISKMSQLASHQVRKVDLPPKNTLLPKKLDILPEDPENSKIP